MKPIRSVREFEQMQRCVVTEATASRAPSIMRTSRAQPLVDQFFGLVDQRDLEWDRRDFLDPEKNVLEGQPGIELGQLLRGDLVPRLRDQFRLDARGDYLAVDEHAVEVEYDEVWLGHGFRQSSETSGAPYTKPAPTANSLQVTSLNLYPER